MSTEEPYRAAAVRAQADGPLRDFVLAAARLLEVRRNRDCKPCAKSYYQYTIELEEAWKALRDAADRIGT